VFDVWWIARNLLLIFPVKEFWNRPAFC